MKLIILITIIFGFLLTAPLTSASTCGVFEKRINNTCIKFTVPSNAHLTYSGNSWDCNRGFKISEDNSKCEEIKVPVNATANTIGDFYCNSGFKRVGNECEKVPVIENGKFYEFGDDFFCNKGYKRVEEARKCDKIIIPKNAFEDDTSLNGWNCFSGYLKEGNECKKFDLPEHGFWFHDFWGCEPGYKKISDRRVCEKISIPENAHPDNSFYGWSCNSSFTKNYHKNSCDKVN